MKPGLWAEIHRLHEVEKLSKREIALRIPCSRNTVRRALASLDPPMPRPAGKRASKLAPYKARIEELLQTYPRLSAVRILEEIRKLGYAGGPTILTDYLRTVRPPRRQRVYQEVEWAPGDALQVDWGHCGSVAVGSTRRKVSVFAAILCYSRVIYIEFTLQQRKETFYRGILHALDFFGGSPRHIIVDNLKAAVLEGHGREARFHPEFLDLCGHYRMQAVACQRKDPESKGLVEGVVRYVKHNALAGRDLQSFGDYQRLAVTWRDHVNARQHRTLQAAPIDCLPDEGLRPLGAVSYDACETHSCVVSSHARVCFDSNRYSVGPEHVGRTVILKADHETVRLFHGEEEIARHGRSYDHGQRIVDPAHRVAALRRQKRDSRQAIEARFDRLGPEAIAFRKGLRTRPVKSVLHLRRVLRLVPLYGQTEVRAAIETACQYHGFDAAYVENLIQQARRRRLLPSPLELRPQRMELLDTIDLEEPDPGLYDQLTDKGEGDDENE